MKVKWYEKVFYGAGNLGYSAVSQTISNFFMFFGTSVLKLPGTLIGIVIAVSTLWDAISDPVVGYISDNKKVGVLGYRHGYMLIATFGMSIINILIWCVPNNISLLAKFIWIFISLVLIETFNTLFATPYSALGTEITTDYNERTSIQIYRTIFFLIGMIVPSVLMFLFLPSTPQFPQGQLNPEGYKNIAIVTSIIAIFSGIITVFGTIRHRQCESNVLKILKNKNVVNKNIKIPIFKNTFFKIKATTKNKKNCFVVLKNMMIDFTSCLKNKNLKYLIFGYSISLISASILTSLGMHFFTYCFYYSSSQITILLLSLIFGMILSQPLWYYLSQKNDKLPALKVGMLISILGVFLIMFVFIFRDLMFFSSFYIILFTLFVIGVGTGALYSLPTSMYADSIQLANENNAKKKTATYTGFLTFSCNIANSFSLLFVGIMLDVMKFDPSVEIQSRPVQTGIAIVLFLGIIISFIISYLIFSKYGVKKKHFKKKNMIEK